MSDGGKRPPYEAPTLTVIATVEEATLGNEEISSDGPNLTASQ